VAGFSRHWKTNAKGAFIAIKKAALRQSARALMLTCSPPGSLLSSLLHLATTAADVRVSLHPKVNIHLPKIDTKMLSLVRARFQHVGATPTSVHSFAKKVIKSYHFPLTRAIRIIRRRSHIFFTITAPMADTNH
jgi:hypothetical protein